MLTVPDGIDGNLFLPGEVFQPSLGYGIGVEHIDKRAVVQPLCGLLGSCERSCGDHPGRMAVLVPGERAGHAGSEDGIVDAAFQNGAAGDGKVVHRVREGDDGTQDAGALRRDDVVADRFSVQKGGEDIVWGFRKGVFCDLHRLIGGGAIHTATYLDFRIRDGGRRGCTGCRKADDTVCVRLNHNARGREELAQIGTAVINREPTKDGDGGHIRIDGIGENTSDDVRKDRGKRNVGVETAIVAALGNQPDAGHAGKQVFILASPLDGFQELPQDDFSFVGPRDGGAVCKIGQVVSALTGQHKAAADIHHIYAGAAVRQHQQGIGVIPYLRLEGVVGQLIVYDGAFAVGNGAFNILVCVNLSVVADFIKCHQKPPPMPAAGAFLP